MSIFIDGIGIAEYRSFGPDVQCIGPFQKINLFIGQNNSGKSNILRFLADHYTNLAKLARPNGRGTVEFTDFDRHLGSTSGRMKFALAIQPEGEKLEAILQPLQQQLNPEQREWIATILSSETMIHGTSLAWFEYTSAWDAAPELNDEMFANLRAENVLIHGQWQQLWSALTRKGRGNIEQHWIPETIRVLDPASLELPTVTLVPAIRQIDATDAIDQDFSGVGLVDRLARLQNPDTDRDESQEQFTEINRFLQSVVGSDDATLEIPYSRDRILVKMDGKTLPLASLGTGIHEVIIIAAAATVLREQVLCLEEPEIHLHPTLQRKLIRYISEHTDNQYFIATHSAHLLNMEDVAVFHVSIEDGQSRVRQTINPADKAAICTDLGYRASDILQANCIVWVEGPSDRIYLNNWIRSQNADMIEGLHYSIMFYGGRLLSHLTANDPEVDDFISLRRLNRNIVILIDSDKGAPRKRLNATKRRVVSEFNEGAGFAWVTKGREIENYISPTLLGKAVREVHPRAVDIAEHSQYARCLIYKTRQGDERTADKIKVAHKVTEKPPDFDVLDLKAQVDQLIQFIDACNQ